MSINWVMLDGQNFVHLPGERTIHISHTRTSLGLSTPKTYPANDPVSIHSDAGKLFLTNQRLVYLPNKPTEAFKSFSAPLLNLHDTHITVPWFGPNAWQAVVQPVPGGNLPAVSTGIELKLTFKEGGAPTFHADFERIKERLHQAVENAREMGTPQRNGNFLNGVDMDTVHLDQLPTYEASGQDRVASPEEPPQPATSHNLGTRHADPQTILDSHQNQTTSNPPADAPPNYEETQQQSLQQALDRRLSGL